MVWGKAGNQDLCESVLIMRKGERLKVKNFFKLYPWFKAKDIGFDVWEGSELWEGQDCQYWADVLREFNNRRIEHFDYIPSRKICVLIMEN